MGKSKRLIESDEEAPKKKGRQAGAKTYKKPTLYKIINDCKPTNMLVWATVAEQYRIQCGELEARPATTIKRFFFQKMCDKMRKPTGSSGIDDFTQKCQTLYRSLASLEEGDTFGGSEDEDSAYAMPDDTSDSGSDDEQVAEIQRAITPTHTTINPALSGTSSSLTNSMRSDTKSKNAKPNPTSRLNVGK
jgi:hypothetical protein